MGYRVRALSAKEWRQLRELRLAALADPLASVAFVTGYAWAAEQPESYWRRRAAAGEGRDDSVIVIGEDISNGDWVGMVAVQREGAADAELLSVYVRPEHRGTGLAAELVKAAATWVWAAPGAQTLRLWVHQDNRRAEAFYQRMGFRRTGNSKPLTHQPGCWVYEMELDESPEPGRSR